MASACNGDARTRRVPVLDAMRGIALVSMVAFHAMYDIVYLHGVSVPWFSGGIVQDVWRASISWCFLALAGWMTIHSHSNVRRAAWYAVAACVIWSVTSLAQVDIPISFGIIYCMAVSTALYAAISWVLPRSSVKLSVCIAAVLLACFFLTYRIPFGRYPVPYLAWLGFPGYAFSSGDYYPIVPYAFLYLAAAFLARAWLHAGKAYPAWMYRDPLPLLSRLGRWSLNIYLLHQPVLLAVLGIVFG